VLIIRPLDLYQVSFLPAPERDAAQIVRKNALNWRIHRKADCRFGRLRITDAAKSL